MKKNLVQLVLLILLLPFSVTAFAGNNVILNIASYHSGYEWTDDCITGIDQVLGKKYKVLHYYMDTKRLQKSEFPNAAEKAWEVYQQLQPDIVMLGDDNALKFMGPKFINKNVTVVYYGINGNPRTYFNGVLPPNVKGILERVPMSHLARQVVDIVKANPNKQITLLQDGSTSSAAQLQTRFHGKRETKVRDFQLLFVDLPEWSEWKRYVENAHQKNAALIFMTYHALKDNGKAIDYKKALNWASQHAKVPIFITQTDVGPEMATGALLIDGVKHGELAADLVDNILQQKQINTLAEDHSAKYLFSQSQFNRFNLKIPETVGEESKIVE